MLATLFLSAALAGELKVHVMDVGQGDAILVTTPAGKHVLIDAGDDLDDTAPQLQALGVESLALVVATHAHADHIGGMRPVIEGFEVGMYIDSGLPHTSRTYTSLMQTIEARGVTYKAARVGQVYKLDDGITVRVLWPTDTPLKDTRSDLNSNSVVLRVDHGEDCFLFTGDSEEDTERAMLSRGVETCDVLKVAHHGSRHSTSEYFVDAVSPTIALISVGAGNSYGHPGAETVERLSRAGATIYRTDLSGHITVVSTGNGIYVSDGLPYSPRPTVSGGGWGGSQPGLAATASPEPR